MNQRQVRVWHLAGRVRRKTVPTEFGGKWSGETAPTVDGNWGLEGIGIRKSLLHRN